MKFLLFLLLGLFAGLAIAGGSSPGLTYGQVPTAAQWNSYFAAKLDFNPGPANTVPYWDGSGNLLFANVSGDCTSIADVFTCTKINGVTTYPIPVSGIISATAPIIASSFGTSPTITANGTAAGVITIGSGGSASSGVLTMPTAAHGWACKFTDVTNNASFVTDQSATSATSVTATNYSRTTGLTTAWTAADAVQFACLAY